MSDFRAIRRQLLRAIVLNPSSKPRDAKEALDELEAAEDESSLPAAELTEEQKEWYDSGVKEELELILDDDPEVLASMPDTTSLLHGIRSYIELLEEALGNDEADRWCGPLEQGRRSAAKGDAEAEAQRAIWRQQRGRQPPEL